ncbi:hypothetical protein LR48_Vigan01g058800 [Vigna angularis]|uniref:Uncharacterized protein n=1 Tax=Phaseolus angularis TaxID=3914 RepID=A0A0L9TKC1_PHAAN|nr:hypothetical protein LR48_Vigan01g058800 [Vigna angularis]
MQVTNKNARENEMQAATATWSRWRKQRRQQQRDTNGAIARAVTAMNDGDNNERWWQQHVVTTRWKYELRITARKERRRRFERDHGGGASTAMQGFCRNGRDICLDSPSNRVNSSLTKKVSDVTDLIAFCKVICVSLPYQPRQYLCYQKGVR